MKRGWFKESHRHSLAARGVSTNYYRKKRSAEDVAKFGKGPAFTPPKAVKPFKRSGVAMLSLDEFARLQKKRALMQVIEGRAPKKLRSIYNQRFKGVTFEQGERARERVEELSEKMRDMRGSLAGMRSDLKNLKKQAKEYEEAGMQDRAEMLRSQAESMSEDIKEMSSTVKRLKEEKARERAIVSKVKEAQDALVQPTEIVARYSQIQGRSKGSDYEGQRAELEQAEQVKKALMGSEPVRSAEMKQQLLKKAITKAKRSQEFEEIPALEAEKEKLAAFVAGQERLVQAKPIGTGLPPIFVGVKTPIVSKKESSMSPRQRGRGSITVGQTRTPEGEKVIVTETVQPTILRGFKEKPVPFGRFEVIRSIRQSRREAAAEGAEKAPGVLAQVFPFRKGHAPWRMWR